MPSCFVLCFFILEVLGPVASASVFSGKISQKRHEAEPCSRGDKIYHICKQEGHFITKNRVLLGMIAAPHFARQAQAPVFFRDALDFTAQASLADLGCSTSLVGTSHHAIEYHSN